ncbi:hypothetical protein PBI_SCTP2_491 [Salicola phage SCTP-2]|nr:hypothetical protein PBI_SCTP2_491 [Salicola phage SCTP-2]
MIYLDYSQWNGAYNTKQYLNDYIQIPIDISTLLDNRLFEFYCCDKCPIDFFCNEKTMSNHDKRIIFNFMYEHYPHYLTLKWSFPIIPASHKEFKYKNTVNNVLFIDDQLYQHYVNKIDHECNNILKQIYITNESLRNKINRIYIYPYNINLTLYSIKSAFYQITSIDDVEAVKPENLDFQIDTFYRYRIVFEIEEKNVNYLKLDSYFIERFLNNGKIYDSYEEVVNKMVSSQLYFMM